MRSKGKIMILELDPRRCLHLLGPPRSLDKAANSINTPPLTSSSSSPPQGQDQQQQQPPILNSYMLYRKEVYANNFALFKSMRASGATISRAISQAWKNEPEDVKRKFEYEAELERVRQQGQMPLGYEYRKRKSDTMTTGGNGKGKASASSSSTTTTKAKNKTSKAATTKSSSSASGSGSGSGRTIRKADFLGSSSLGFGLGSLALSSPMALSSSSSSPRLGSVPERMVVGSDAKRNNSAEGSHSSTIQSGIDLAALISGAAGEHGRSGNSNIGRQARGQARRTKSSASTTAATAAAAVAKTRQRSKSEGGTTHNLDLDNAFQDKSRARHRLRSDHSHKQVVVQITDFGGRDPYAETSGSAFASMQIQEGLTIAGQDVIMSDHHSQPHLHHAEGEEGADDDNDNTTQDEEDVALREDRVVIKRRKSLLHHHKK
ncbi:hypothetical protein BGX24_000677 [Mortierella sp. AD032]|nr:hypothetical protein BGX24_000677 [Mortierella sp. AD032]